MNNILTGPLGDDHQWSRGRRKLKTKKFKGPYHGLIDYDKEIKIQGLLGKKQNKRPSLEKNNFKKPSRGKINLIFAFSYPPSLPRSLMVEPLPSF